VAVGREVDGDFRDLNEKNLENPPLWNGRKLTQQSAEQVNALLKNIAQNNGRRLIDVLMKYKDTEKDPPLMQALRADDYQAAVMLIDYGVDVNRRGPCQDPCGESAIEFAVRTQKIDLVDRLLKKKADPFSIRHYSESVIINGRCCQKNGPMKTAVSDAITLGSIETIALMILRGVYLGQICYSEKYGSSGANYKPIQFAMNQGKTDIAELLLSKGVKL